VAGGGTGRALPFLLVGATCGLAWASGLRGFLAMIAGTDSDVSWSGTFLWVLLPGTATGALLGWAEHLRRTGGRPGWRWVAASPLLFLGVLDGMAGVGGGPATVLPPGQAAPGFVPGVDV
jgi:hypothetical protein